MERCEEVDGAKGKCGCGCWPGTGSEVEWSRLYIAVLEVMHSQVPPSKVG